MHSFFFGANDQQLYGAFSPSSGRHPGSSAVLLCYPFGVEQTRYHMAFRKLANLISRKSGGVLRFDFFGTGDSAGSLEQATFPIWVDNTRTAVEELKALSGANSVSIVGLGLGALVAANAAEGRTDLDSCILWDPVLSGEAFLEDMFARKTTEIDGTWWVDGFPVSGGFRESLASAGYDLHRFPSRARIFQLESRMSDAFGEVWRQFDSLEASAIRKFVPGPPVRDEIGEVLLPGEIIRTVADWTEPE